MDRTEVLARRLIAQGLAPSQARPAFATPAEVTAGLLALQGQNYPAGVRAIALRCALNDAAVLDAIESGQIVRSWPQRGTLHFLSAGDVTWLSTLLRERVERSQAARRAGLDLEPAMVVAARRALEDATSSSALPISRKDAYAIFAAAGVDPAGGRGPHLLRAFGGEGTIIQGPKERTKLAAPAAETFTHVRHLPVPQHEWEESAAWAHLGARYAAGHGPVEVADLAYWSYIPKSLAKNALESADGIVKRVGSGDAAGREFYLARWQEDVTAAELHAALKLRIELPAFDEILLGYADKKFIVPDDDVRKNVLTSNGLSWPWVLQGGEGVASLRATG